MDKIEDIIRVLKEYQDKELHGVFSCDYRKVASAILELFDNRVDVKIMQTFTDKKENEE